MVAAAQTAFTWHEFCSDTQNTFNSDKIVPDSSANCKINPIIESMPTIVASLDVSSGTWCHLHAIW